MSEQPDDGIEHLRGALAVATAHLDDRDGRIEALLADAQVLLDEKHAALDGMKAFGRDLAAARAEISGLKSMLAARDREHLAALGQAHNDGFNEGKAAVDDQLDQLHRALAEVKVELERLERELRARALFHVVRSPGLHPVDSAPSAG